MRLTVVGCAGSFPGPDSASSCYLLEAPFEGGTYRLVLDLGSGSFGSLQRHIDPREIDAIALSHLHADHCFDMSGLYVVSKYHPQGRFDRIPVLAPAGADEFLTDTYGREDEAGMGGQFAFSDWVDHGVTQLGPFTVTGRRVDHPVPAYGMRVEAGGVVLAYSGDTGPTPALDDLVTGADVFLCEASFVESAENPPNLHLTGAEAGRYAADHDIAQLLVTHIPAWTDRAEVEADVKTTWDGPCELVRAGSTYDF